jgi:hypothetical protein
VAALLHEQPIDRAAPLALDREAIRDLLVDAHLRGARGGGRVVVVGRGLLLALGDRDRGDEQGGCEEDCDSHRPDGIHSASPKVATKLLV